MLRSFSILAAQLKLACKHSNARWAVYLYQTQDQWRLLAEHGLSKTRRVEVLKLLAAENSRQWLDETLAAGKLSSQPVESKKSTWRCQNMYALPAENVPGLLLIGADALSDASLAYFSLLALDLPQLEPVLLMGSETEVNPFDNAVAVGISDYMAAALENLLQVVSADVAYLALKFEGSFRITAVQNLPPDLNNMLLDGDLPVLRELEETAGILERPDSLIEAGEADTAVNWAYLPLVYQREVIGLAAFGRPQCLTLAEMVSASKAARLMAPALVRQLDQHEQQVFIQRLSLIDRLASLATPETGLEAYGTAAAKLLARAFKAEHVGLWLADENGQYTDLAADNNNTGAADLAGTLEGSVLKVEQTIRINDLSGQSEYTSQHESVQAKMVTPLRAYHEIIGVVSLESETSHGYSIYDEMLLGLLADQLAAQLSGYRRSARLYRELDQRIKEQQMVEERLIRSAKLAAVGEMAAGVAHELNNPLTTVTGFAELILDTIPKDAPEYEDMNLVLQEAHRARGVVRRLLDFSRQSEVLWMEVDINELLSTVLALVHHLALTSGVDVRVELWDELPLIRADRNQMQQVLLNLIHNAIQAMPGGGQLVLRTQVELVEEERWISIEVQDNGQGITADDLEKVFEPFFTTKPTGVGTGLGLSVSYGIVSDHGGYIDVESQPGEGAIFTVWLPVETAGTDITESGDA